MVALSDPACKRCGGRMGIVADISPRDPEPGLRAFVCSECGAVESVLIYPDNHFGPKDPTYNGKRLLNSASCPMAKMATGIGKSSRTAARLLRAALPRRSPVPVNRRMKRRERWS